MLGREIIVGLLFEGRKGGHSRMVCFFIFISF